MKFLLTAVLCFLILTIGSAQTYDQQWAKIDSLEHYRELEAAIPFLEKLIDQAQNDSIDLSAKAYYVKALIFKNKYEVETKLGLKDNIGKERICYLEIIDSLKPRLVTLAQQSKDGIVQSLLYANLADLLAKYQRDFYVCNKILKARIAYKRNANGLSEKIPNSTQDSLDNILRGYQEEMTNYLLLSTNSSSTKTVSARHYRLLLDNEKPIEGSPLDYSLSDLLIENAINYLINNSNYTTYKNSKEKQPLQDSFALAKLQDFIQFDFTSKDKPSRNVQIYKLYQTLLRTHLKNGQRNLLAKFDLERMLLGLSYDNIIITNEKNKSFYLDRLLEMEQTYLDVPMGTRISYKIATSFFRTYRYYAIFRESIYNDRWNIKRAHDICQATIKRFPKSIGAKNCHALLHEILQKSLSLSIEAVTPTNQAILAQIESKNVDKIYCQLLPLPKDYYKEKAALNLLEYTVNKDSVWATYIQGIKSKKTNTWEQEIPLAGDFKSRSIEIKVPAQQAGAYLLVLSNKADFSYNDNAFVYAYLQVSDLAFLARARSQKEKVLNEFFIVNRKNGAPIKGAKIQFLEETWKQIEAKRSDRQGHVTTPLNSETPYSIRIKKGKDQLYLDDTQLHYTDSRSLREGDKAYLFTDKPIYRPGQEIQYKGILTHFNKNGTSDILSNTSTKISFYNANRGVVSERLVITNEYGAYSGSFTIPSSILLGKMYLQDSFTESKVYFNVEEYKKPTIQAKMESFVVNGETKDTLIVLGIANTFSKIPLADAQVNYYITKSYFDTLNVSSTFVNNNGKFYIRYAIPKETDTLKYNNQYRCFATIVDLTGETKELESNAYQPNPNYYRYRRRQLKGDLEIDFFNKNEILRSDTALIGGYEAYLLLNEIETPTKITSKLLIEQLETPKHTPINRLWSAPDTSIFTAETFEKDFPLYEYYQKQRDFKNWITLDTVYQANFDAASTKDFRHNTTNWATGFYRITFTHTDSAGYESIEGLRYFRVADHIPSPPYNEALLNYNKWADLTGEPKDTVLLEVGSYFEDAHILLELESNKKVHEYRWLQPKAYEEVPIIIKEKHRGNLQYRLLSIYNNRFQKMENHIEVPWTNKELNIEYVSFRDKLLPGQAEEWTIKITSADGKAVAAEILASMYDSALDKLAYKPWEFELYNKRGYRSLADWSSFNNIKMRAFDLKEHPNWQLPLLNYAELISPSIKNAQNFLKFNRFWYSKAPTPDDLDGDGVPNEQDIEPNSLPYYRVTSQGRNVVERIPIVDSEEVSMSKSYRYSSNSTYSDGAVGSAAYGNPSNTEYEDFDEDGIANRRNFPSSDVIATNFGNVKVRSDLKESVFFYPHLKTNEDGSVLIKFTMSEALSKWKFRTIAHTKDLKTVMGTKDLITQKELMVMPSTPRFLRQGDVVEITSKVSNLSKKTLKGKITLQLFDATTKIPIDLDFENNNTIQAFDLDKGAVTKVSWTLRIPETWANPVLYKIIAKSGNFSDGEQNQLPVISNRMLVLESLPILAHGKSTQNYVFKGLKENNSSTLQQHQFSLKLSPNPAWDAILSLPYLIEYPYECSEQLFSRFYANSLATQIVNSTPKIKATFEAWAAKETPSSNLNELLKNPSLKSALLEETPWVLNSKSDAEQQKSLGQLFDLNQMAKMSKNVGKKLLERQAKDGGFAWFNGGSSSPFITQYIVSGLAKLEKLGANPFSENWRIQKMKDKALVYLDQQIIREYKSLSFDYNSKPKYKKDTDAMRLEDNLTHNAIQYLYAKSFFWFDVEIQKDSSLTQSINYYLEQAKLHWRNKSTYQQGLLALTAYRINKKSQFAQMIVNSLRNQATVDSTEGMYWEQPWSFYWYRLPIETQAIMIELFEEVAKDEAAVYSLKLWLLQQKKGAAWASTKATTTASYALLMSGGDWLDNEAGLSIKIGQETIESKDQAQEIGTGYFKKTWSADAIQKDLANITIENKNSSPAIGAAYWQYFENFENINSFQETPLKIKKELFLQTQTTKGTINTPIKESNLKPGDLILVRIELEVGKDMEYLHLKDMRAAGFEPTNVLSSYKYQNGMGYYEMTKDASSNFFFSQLRKGKHVFEYTLRAAHKGQFSNGITTVQSMYTPEFTAHSKAINIVIE
jgi:hypothetical protein